LLSHFFPQILCFVIYNSFQWH